MTRKLRIPTAILMAIALVAGGASTAWAIDNIVPTANYNFTCQNATQLNPKNVCRTDNASTGWWMERNIDFTTSASDTTAEININKTMNNSYDGTDLDTFYDSTPVFSGAGETDVIYRSNNAAFGSTDFIGYTWCDDDEGGSTYECDQQYVNFRSLGANRALACHETGHSVGLLHGDNASPYVNPRDPDNDYMACMTNPLVNGRELLEPSNVANINGAY